MTQKGQRQLVGVGLAIGTLGPGSLAWIHETGSGVLVLVQTIERVFGVPGTTLMQNDEPRNSISCRDFLGCGSFF